MSIRIEPFEKCHLKDVVALSLRAWAPVFPSIEASLQPEVYQAFYPEGWETSQAEAVEAVCLDRNSHVWVVIDGETVTGFGPTPVARYFKKL